MQSLFDLFLWPFANWSNILILWPLGIFTCTWLIYTFRRLM